MRSGRSTWLAALGLSLGAGCAAVAPPQPSSGALVEALGRLGALRAQVSAPRTDEVTLTIDAPYLPSPLRARGGVAVDPAAEAVRVILLGPGGTTALDFWSRDEWFRLRIPAAGRDERGGRGTPLAARRGLPIELFRWWFVDPFAGEVLFAVREADGVRAVLRDGAFITHLTLADDGSVAAHRAWWRDEPDGGRTRLDDEWIRAAPFPCGEVRYEQRSTRLVVRATCERTRPGAEARALEEPAP